MPRKDKVQAGKAVSDGRLVVTAQQSRYQVDAVDAPVSKEVLVKTLCVSVGQREILQDAELHLVEGRHYVLVGRNGTGKSTLLRAIGTAKVPSIAPSLRVLLLGQTEAEQDKESVDSISKDLAALAPPSSESSAEHHTEEQTVLEHVLRADKTLTRLQSEADALLSALNASDPVAPVRVIRALRHDRLERLLETARLIAERRSGARGKNARAKVVEMEEMVKVSRETLDVSTRDLDTELLAKETKEAADTLADLQVELEGMDASAASAHAQTVLLGLGFTAESIHQPVSHLSGGWHTRCKLACSLCQTTDLLLLDEPTNYLDLPSIIWLQNHIRENLNNTTVVLVTHDRAFADAVADELLVLRNQQLESFRGNLSLYERERYKYARWMQKMKDAQDRANEQLNSSLEASARAARKAGDDKKLKQVAGRKKKIEERSGLLVSAKGTRFKRSRDRPGPSNTLLAEIEVPKFDPPPRMAIPLQPPALNFPGALVCLDKVTYRHPGAQKDVLKDIDLIIHPTSRIGFAGLNGAGKSTLVNLINGTLIPAKGTLTRHPRARISCFSQRAVEALDALPGAQHTSALLRLFSLFASTNGSGGSSSTTGINEQTARGLLAGLGLQGAAASDVPITALSGGQKVRLALAELLWPAPPHLLVLDEVTTHLDADTILVLTRALRRFEGAVLVVSHDRAFVRGVVEGKGMGVGVGVGGGAADKGKGGEKGSEGSEESDEEEENGGCEGKVYRVAKGRVELLEGGMDAYEEIAARASARLGKA